MHRKNVSETPEYQISRKFDRDLIHCLYKDKPVEHKVPCRVEEKLKCTLRSASAQTAAGTIVPSAQTAAGTIVPFAQTAAGTIASELKFRISVIQTQAAVVALSVQ
jgi:hypothetical protein